MKTTQSFGVIVTAAMLLLLAADVVKGEDCSSGSACDSALSTCEVAGTKYCCLGGFYTVTTEALNGKLQSCTCVSTPGRTGNACRSRNASSSVVASGVIVLLASFLGLQMTA